MSGTTVVWLRRDLRLDDNPALAAAAQRGVVIPVFVWAPGEEGDWAPGAASRVWLHHSLHALRSSLREPGLRLIIRRGESGEVLARLAEECGADAVYWNRLYEPDLIRRDTAIKRDLRASGLEALSFNAALLNEPPAVANKQGKPFRVFTPFYKHCKTLGVATQPTEPPRVMAGPQRWPAGEAIDDLGLLPGVAWDDGIRAAWTPGERGAARELDVFADAAVSHYATGRDQPGNDGVSRLSPFLHFGEISPRRVWHTLAGRWPGRGDGDVSVQIEPFTRQLYWREFAHHLLYHFPNTTHEPLYPKYRDFPWDGDGRTLRAWQRGRTGYPLVDAGMRQLWTTGWMHNRVRMNVASFLVKHLLTHWLEGARWFWDTLVDADLANNTMGWQWSAGCGADAAPYFRIFNPVKQGERFDPQGHYVRRWIPELAKLPAKHIHAPWQAPPAVLHDAGVRLGKDYPSPIVDHPASRRRALDALATTRS